jgi:hypothetical protein
MLKPMVKMLWVAVLGIAACASQSSFLKSKEPTATETALVRGRFDLNCPAAIAVVLSEDYIQPAVEGRWATAGVTRAEYTIGVEGCDKRETYVVMCQEGTTTCFAASRGGAQAQ